MSAPEAQPGRRDRRGVRLTVSLSEVAWVVLMVVVAAQSVCLTLLLLDGAQP